MGTEMLRGVYPERSEGLSMTIPVLVVKIHNRALPFTRMDGDPGRIMACFFEAEWSMLSVSRLCALTRLFVSMT